MKQPNPRNHLNISLIKSAFRIISGVFLIYGDLVCCGTSLILAELLGILEELV